MSDPLPGTDDLWTPPPGTQLVDLRLHPEARGVSAMAWMGERPEPCPHWFRPWFNRRYNALRCGRCGFTWRGHRAANERARAELARRRGKHEDPCPPVAILPPL